jgi:hypothetical protein
MLSKPRIFNDDSRPKNGWVKPVIAHAAPPRFLNKRIPLSRIALRDANEFVDVIRVRG